MGESRQIKSKERVQSHGEVFTNEREVKAMCDLVKQETERIDSRFLEPACGDGNFLSEILHRKLEVVQRKYRKSVSDYEKYAILALSSLYGVDILSDNAAACRERLFREWDEAYTAVCKNECSEETRTAARYLLERNIICGNALSMMCVDEQGRDTEKPIIFSEWSFVTGYLVKRRDFRLDVLLKENDDPNCYDTRLSLFSDTPDSMENWMIDPATGEPTPKPVREFPPIHFRRLSEHG